MALWCLDADLWQFPCVTLLRSYVRNTFDLKISKLLINRKGESKERRHVIDRVNQNPNLLWFQFVDVTPSAPTGHHWASASSASILTHRRSCCFRSSSLILGKYTGCHALLPWSVDRLKQLIGQGLWHVHSTFSHISKEHHMKIRWIEIKSHMTTRCCSSDIKFSYFPNWLSN